MLIVGLTGSIAMGKSVTSQMFKRLGVPIIDADRIVHELYSGVVVPQIQRIFPQAVCDGVVNRQILSRYLLQNPDNIKILESIIHPYLIKAANQRLKKAQSARKSYVIIDVPLLFESNIYNMCDFVVTVTCSPLLQRMRVMQRPHMTKEKFDFIRARQLKDFFKCLLSDYTIYSGSGMRTAFSRVMFIDRYIRKVCNKKGRWKPGGLYPRPHNGYKLFCLRQDKKGK